MEWTNYLIAALGAFVAGAINALAGGGTLITFPLLVALGLPPVSANITNTLVLIPGYLGGVYAQREDLSGQKNRLWPLLVVAAVGGLLGGILLMFTTEKFFARIVPFLVLLATLLLAIGDPLRNWLQRRSKVSAHRHEMAAALFPVLLAGIYGGYFGGVMSVIVLAILGLCFNDSLTRLNALKQAIAFAANIMAAILFVFSGKVVWGIGIVMAAAALLGGTAGGRLAGRVKPEVLRWIVVGIGVTVAVIYFVK